MAIESAQERESEQLSIAFQGIVPPPSFVSDEMDIIAFRLWQRINYLGMMGEECGCCKGEAQQCYASCR